MSSTLRKVVPAFSARSPAALDHRAIGDGIGERHAQFDQVRAAALQRRNQRRRAVGRRVACGDIGDQAFLPAVRAADRTTFGFACPSARPVTRPVPEILAVNIDVLSPRPERFTTNTLPAAAGARRIASATACADSSAGMMPSVRDSKRRGLERFAIAGRDVFGAAGVVQPGVLRADQRVIQARPRPSA